MAPTTLTASLLLALACGAQAFHLDDPTLAAAFPLDTATLQEVAAATDLDGRLLGAMTLGSGLNCTASCNGESYGALGKDSEEGVDCWGTFKAFCKASCDKACALGAYACEGHFVGFKTKCGSKVGVCAGASKKFGKALIRTKEGPIKVFKAGGGIGVHAAAMASPNISLPASIDFPATLAEAGGLTELYEGQLHTRAAELEEGPYTLKKAFGDGAGGGFVAVKKLGAADVAAWEAKHPQGYSNMDYEALAAKAERKMHKLGITLPVETSVLDVSLAPLVTGGKCEVTCNGRPAWFKGGFPCYGKLKVFCVVETEEAHGLSPAGAAEDVVIYSKAGCAGFWTGVFGKKCLGFSYSKTHVKALDKYAYCSGKKGIFAKKKEGAFVAGGGCAGKALFALQYTPESSTTAPVA